jgi:glucan phosphoethanolaminetransferase (alkaline phosphatase superfamily)
MAVLLLTVLAWPVTALARRTYRATPRPVGTAVRLARLGVRLAAVLVLLALAGWTVVLMTLLGQFVMPPVALLRALQVATATGLVVLVAAAAWRVWTTWRTGTPWRARVWAPVVLLAAAATTWFSHAYGLLSPSVTI